MGKFKLPAHESDKVAIALSGGPDSIALAALTARWHRQTKSHVEPPLALVVDHKLRPESTDEAHEAAERAAAMGLRSQVLTVDWGNSLPKRSHKMRAAREARYSLLLTACQRAGVQNLMTAHHADDQAETFLLRLIHASGIDGLAGIAKVNNTYVPTYGVRILRPLLGIHKQELFTICQDLQLDFATDPTNRDPSFQRNRLRLLLEEAAAIEALELSSTAIQMNEEQSEDSVPTAPQIIKDILTLQKLCACVSRDQQHEANGILRRSLIHASQIPLFRPRHSNSNKNEVSVDSENNNSFSSKRVNWPSKLSLISRQLHRIPHVILQTRPFGAAEEPVTAAAISQVLQSVSGSEYPPKQSDSTRLAQRLAGGKLVGGFTGGGCTVQPIVRSKGHYILVFPQQYTAQVEQVKEYLRRHKFRNTAMKINGYNDDNDDESTYVLLSTTNTTTATNEDSDGEGMVMREASG